MARRRRKLRLEMTSLMDVMFLLLVFFIYCVFDMTVHKGVKVELPAAAGTLEKGERLIVTIRADETLQLNGAPIGKDGLLAKVAALRSAGVNFPLIISGDRKASLGTGISLLAELKARGVEKISFQVSGERAE
jgi:biopolymer transport protein ExbD